MRMISMWNSLFSKCPIFISEQQQWGGGGEKKKKESKWRVKKRKPTY